MRIFERRAGESIRIGDEVEIRVLDTDNGRVRLGIEAPRDVRIMSLDKEDQADDMPARSGSPGSGSTTE